MKTQAVVFAEAGQARLQELTLDALGPRDIAVRTLVTAISPGTERWVLKGKHIGTAFPCVPGYHRIGIVEQCGGAVAALHPGDLVYGTGNRWAEAVRSMWGAHCGYSVGPAEAYKFLSAAPPDPVELETTVFTMGAAVAYRGVQALDPKPGDALLIIGGGFIGLCAAQLAVRRGARPLVMDNDPEKVAFAGRLGVAAVDAADPGFEAALKAHAPAGFDQVYDSAGVPDAIDRAVAQARRRGTLLLQAQYFDKEHRAIDLDQIKIKEMTVRTTCGVPGPDWDATLDLIRRRRLNVAPLITHRFGSGRALDGYKLLLDGQPFNLGIVFCWDQALLAGGYFQSRLTAG